MRKFYQEFHTPENLERQIAEVYDLFPNTLVVGSLGRASVFNSHISDPGHEFRIREQHPLCAGDMARDIDTIGADHDVLFPTLPYWVDATSYDIGGTHIAQQNGDWFISVDDLYESPLHPATMEPVEGRTIYEIPCVTVPAETQLALLRVRGKFRAKDVLTFSLLTKLVEKKPSASSLSPELFKPFERVHEINSRKAA